MLGPLYAGNSVCGQRRVQPRPGPAIAEQQKRRVELPSRSSKRSFAAVPRLVTQTSSLAQCLSPSPSFSPARCVTSPVSGPCGRSCRFGNKMQPKPGQVVWPPCAPRAHCAGRHHAPHGIREYWCSRSGGYLVMRVVKGLGLSHPVGTPTGPRVAWRTALEASRPASGAVLPELAQDLALQ